MKINKLASAISRGKWLIEPSMASGLLPLAVKFLNGESMEFFEGNEYEGISLYNKKGAYFDWSTGRVVEVQPIEENSVLVIPINGAIMKDDHCGDPGTDRMSEWINYALANPRISGIVLKINSGGGTVEGTGEFADLIKSASKPVIAYTDGCMASAAYWIGCSAKEVFASHKTVEIGSIGTAIDMYDNREALAKMGYKRVYTNADSSPDKNMDYFNALDGDTTGLKVSVLNPTNDIFMGAVKENRDGKLKIITKATEGKTINEPLTGKMYLAETAIEIGLIDKIGTLQDAVDRALELAA
jgi:ClpP class serine protease